MLLLLLLLVVAAAVIIVNHRESSWIIVNHRESSWIILNHPESSWIIVKRRESSWIIVNHRESSCGDYCDYGDYGDYIAVDFLSSGSLRILPQSKLCTSDMWWFDTWIGLSFLLHPHVPLRFSHGSSMTWDKLISSLNPSWWNCSNIPFQCFRVKTKTCHGNSRVKSHLLTITFMVYIYKYIRVCVFPWYSNPY